MLKSIANLQLSWVLSVKRLLHCWADADCVKRLHLPSMHWILSRTDKLAAHRHKQTNWLIPYDRASQCISPWLQSGNIPSSDDTTSSLNVIIEAEVLVAHPFQDGKGLVGLEILKLDEAVGEAVLSCCTELFHHLHVLITCQPLLLAALQAQVKSKPNLSLASITKCLKDLLTGHCGPRWLKPDCVLMSGCVACVR